MTAIKQIWVQKRRWRTKPMPVPLLRKAIIGEIEKWHDHEKYGLT